MSSRLRRLRLRRVFLRKAMAMIIVKEDDEDYDKQLWNSAKDDLIHEHGLLAPTIESEYCML